MWIGPEDDGAIREHHALELTLDYGAETQAALALGGWPDDLHLERGELRINAGAAIVPETPGLTVVAHLPRWTLAASPDLPEAPLPATGTGLNQIDARIDELLIASQVFPNAWRCTFAVSQADCTSRWTAKCWRGT